jgi:8-oxo-dGTP pyrophosphatase MutT (NUDIX family)
LRFKVQGAAVLPVASDGSVYLVGQWRYVLQRFTWEVIRGSGPVESDPLRTAKRELSEETGFEADEWLELVKLDASPGISSEQARCYVAWSVSQEGRHPDAQETLRLKRLSFPDALQAALAGDIRDAASVALILALHARLVANDLPPALTLLLRHH